MTVANNPFMAVPGVAGNPIGGREIPPLALGGGLKYPFYNYKIDYETVPASKVYNPSKDPMVVQARAAGVPANVIDAAKRAQRGQKLPFHDILVQEGKDFRHSVDQGWFNAADIFEIGDENAWGTDQEEVDRTLSDPEWAQKLMGGGHLDAVIPRDPNATNQFNQALNPDLAKRKSLASISALTPGIADLKDYTDVAGAGNVLTAFVKEFRKIWPTGQLQAESFLPAVVAVPLYNVIQYTGNPLQGGALTRGVPVFNVTNVGAWKKNVKCWDRKHQKTQDFNRAELKKDRECETLCEIDIKKKVCECPDPPLTIEGLRSSPNFWSYSFRMHHLNQYVDVVFPVGATGPSPNERVNFASFDGGARHLHNPGDPNAPDLNSAAGQLYNTLKDKYGNSPPQAGPLIDNYRGYFVADYNEKGTTDLTKEVIGSPAVTPGNVMGTRVIDVDVTSEIGSQQQADGSYWSKTVNHVGVLKDAQDFANTLRPLNNVSVTNTQSTFRVAIAGEDWGAFQPWMNIRLGLTSFSMNINADGMTQSCEWANRPKKLPKQDAIFPKVAHRLKHRGLAAVPPRAAKGNMAAGRARCGGAGNAFNAP